MARWQIIILIVQYVAIAATAAIEAKWWQRPERWPWVLYFLAAAAISVAVLWMGKR